MSQLKYDTTVTDTDRDVAGAVLRAGTTELSATGTSLDVRNTTAEGILTTIDADTGNIALDTAAMVVDLAAIEVEQLAQGVTLDSIETDTGSIDSTLSALSFAGQSTAGATDEGITMHGVRNDVLADLSGGDGNRAPFQFNSQGALYVDQGSATDPSRANTAAATDKKSITTTSATILNAAPLANRKKLFIANEGNKKMYISTGTATDDDFPIGDGKMLELNVGPAIIFTAVTTSGTADCRTLQLS